MTSSNYRRRSLRLVAVPLLAYLFCCILRAEALSTATTRTTKNTRFREQSSSPYEDSLPVRLNEFFKAPVPAPFKGGLSIFREEADENLDTTDLVTLLTAAPGSPAVPKPLWVVMLASLPTGLLWYGYYKFVVEEELLQMELEANLEPRGLGGYGTLGPFTYGMLLGPMASLLQVPGGYYWSLLGFAFLYGTQVLLCDRVNRLYQNDEEGIPPQAPLQVWWCLPIFFPLTVIVGLRQVHFLSQYCCKQRGSLPSMDPVADFFPFIKKSSLTWQELVITPSLWCSALSEIESLDPIGLPEPLRRILLSDTATAE